MECNCGCGQSTSGTAFVRGHDENVRSAVMYLLWPCAASSDSVLVNGMPSNFARIDETGSLLDTAPRLTHRGDGSSAVVLSYDR